MNINLELYKVFYEVAKRESITAASHSLMISQPAISKSIKTLEESLGGKLFIRSKKGVTLTDEGLEFYNYISKSMEYIEAAENKFKELINLESGSIRIGVSTTLTKVFLIPYLELFKKEYPNININISTSATGKLFELLKEGLLDFVIYNAPCDYENEFEVIKLKNIQDAFFVGSELKYLTNKKLRLEQLNNYPLVLQSSDSNIRKYLDDFCMKNSVTLKETMNLSSFTLAFEFTKINYGIGFLTKEYISNEIGKSVFELDVTPKIPNRHIALAYSKKNGINFSTKKFMEILKKELD